MSIIDVRAGSTAEYISAIRWRHGPEWLPRPHSHPFCEVIVPVRGAEHSVVNGRSHVCMPGYVLFYEAGSVHAESHHGTTLLEFVCVQLTWPDYPPDLPPLIRDRQGRILELAQWLEAENFLHYPGSEEYRSQVTKMLVSELLRSALNPSVEVVEHVRAFVQAHLAEPLALDTLAAELGLNKFHLIRSFRALTGLTPMEYVRLIRLAMARQLLVTDGSSAERHCAPGGFCGRVPSFTASEEPLWPGGPRVPTAGAREQAARRFHVAFQAFIWRGAVKGPERRSDLRRGGPGCR